LISNEQIFSNAYITTDEGSYQKAFIISNRSIKVAKQKRC